MSNSISKLFHTGIKKLLYKNPLDGIQVSDLIKAKLSNKEPVMIARFGSPKLRQFFTLTFPTYLECYLKREF